MSHRVHRPTPTLPRPCPPPPFYPWSPPGHPGGCGRGPGPARHQGPWLRGPTVLGGAVVGRLVVPRPNPLRSAAVQWECLLPLPSVPTRPLTLCCACVSCCCCCCCSAVAVLACSCLLKMSPPLYSRHVHVVSLIPPFPFLVHGSLCALVL